MAYFAQLNKNQVVNVISIANDVLGEPDKTFPETEPIGQAFIAEVLGLEGTWKQTSYNGNFRGTFAGIGYSYDPKTDTFKAPKQVVPDLPDLIEG